MAYGEIVSTQVDKKPANWTMGTAKPATNAIDTAKSASTAKLTAHNRKTYIFKLGSASAMSPVYGNGRIDIVLIATGKIVYGGILQSNQTDNNGKNLGREIE